MAERGVPFTGVDAFALWALVGMVAALFAVAMANRGHIAQMEERIETLEQAAPEKGGDDG